jgi:hypothetical protein
MPLRVRKAVGRNVLRKEGAAKTSGAAHYIDDIAFPQLLHARTIRSTIPAARSPPSASISTPPASPSSTTATCPGATSSR